MSITDIRDIAFEVIDGNYYWGKYGDFKVIINIKTGYINATKLCLMAVNKNGQPKQLFAWKQNNATNELLDEVASSLRILRDDVMKVPTDLPIELRGTYVHPKLIPHIAMWASPQFAVKVSDIINAHIVREYKESIRQKDDKIDELMRKVDEQSKQISELLTLARETQEDNHIMSNQIESLTIDIENTSADNEHLTGKVEIMQAQ